MKYYIIYFISFVFLIFIWSAPFHIVDSKSLSPKYEMVDSTVVSEDTLVSPKAVGVKPEEKQIVYVKETPSFWGVSNQVISLVVGLGNLVVLGIQLTKRKH